MHRIGFIKTACSVREVNRLDTATKNKINFFICFYLWLLKQNKSKAFVIDINISNELHIPTIFRAPAVKTKNFPECLFFLLLLISIVGTSTISNPPGNHKSTHVNKSFFFYSTPYSFPRTIDFTPERGLYVYIV
jgi:hypothetical protein